MSDREHPSSSSPPDHAGVAFHPPLLLALAIGAGFGLRGVSRLSFLPDSLTTPLGAIVASAALALFSWAVATMKGNGASISPGAPTDVIVERGPYRFSRNPIYLGMFLLQVGIGIWADSVWFLVMAVLTAVLLTWAMWRGGVAQRFAVIVPLGTFLIVLNPYIEPLVMANITGGPSTHWRGLWALPVAILVSLMLCSPFQLPPRSRGRKVAPWLAAVALAVLVIFIPEHVSFSAEGGLGTRRGLGVRIGAPTLKGPPLEFEWARKLNRSIAPGAAVIAPQDVNTWIPTIHHHASPLEVRPLYTRIFSGREHFPPQEADLRRTLTQIVSNATWAGNEASRRRTLSLFSEGLRRFDVQAVCMAKNGASGHLRRILAASRFRREHDGRRYEIWVRS